MQTCPNPWHATAPIRSTQVCSECPDSARADAYERLKDATLELLRALDMFAYEHPRSNCLSQAGRDAVGVIRRVLGVSSPFVN